jgi:hypothetical protein
MADNKFIDPRKYLGKVPEPVPDWAITMVSELSEIFNIPVPPLTWFKTVENQAGGWYDHTDHRITVIATGKEMDDKLTIAHEMGHAITGDEHTEYMYLTAIAIVEYYNLDRMLFASQEIGYKPEIFASALRKRIEYHEKS